MSKPVNDLVKIVSVKPETLSDEKAAQLQLNEGRILFYAIQKIQTDKNSVRFTKREVEYSFQTNLGNFSDIKTYLSKLRSYGIDSFDEANDKMRFVNAFVQLDYDNGVFVFEFSRKFLPEFDKLKHQRFLLYNMDNVEQFKSKYSIYLYNFLKDKMWGGTKEKTLAIQQFRSIFKLDEEQYKGNNNNFMTRCWLPALEEINLHTGYNIEITSRGRGQNCSYSIVRKTNEDLTKYYSKLSSYCHLEKKFIDSSCSECYLINRCKIPLKAKLDNEYFHTMYGGDIEYFIHSELECNPNYSLSKRCGNGSASPIEYRCYEMRKGNANYDGNDKRAAFYEQRAYTDDNNIIDSEELDNLITERLVNEVLTTSNASSTATDGLIFAKNGKIRIKNEENEKMFQQLKKELSEDTDNDDNGKIIF